MPPKEKPRQTVAGGKGDEGNGVASKDAGQPEAEAMDTGAAAAQEVRSIADKLQAACGKFAEELAVAAEKRLKDHGVTDVVWKDVKAFLSKSKGTNEICQLVEALKKSAPLEMPGPPGTEVHPGLKHLQFRSLLEPARADINDSLDEFVQWLGKQLCAEEPMWKMLNDKKDSFVARNNAVLVSLEQDLKEKVAKEAPRLSFDAGRGSMAWDSGDLGPSVDDNYSQEMDTLRGQIAGLESELRAADKRIAEMAKQVDRQSVLDSAKMMLRCDDLELDGRIAELLRLRIENDAQLKLMQTNIDVLESRLANADASSLQDKIADLEQQLQEAHHKVQQLERSNAELEQQLHEADDNLHKLKESKEKLEKLLEAQLKKLDGETTGTSKPEEIEETPEVKVDDSRSRKDFKRSDSSMGSKANGSSKRPSTKASASPPRTPPPTGDRRKDKIGLSEFLEMYERRVVNCSEDDKVSLLSEYLIGEARRAYKSVMSANASLSFRGLCRELKGMMIDSSRTGKLLKMKRFDDLKIHSGQTYLSFITLIESQAAEAYGDADEWTLDQVKTKVLLSNLRERELVMHVETDLRKLKDDELQFPVVKSLAITYERTDVSVNKWRSQGKTSYRGDSTGSNQQPNGQVQQWDVKSEGTLEQEQSQVQFSSTLSGLKGSFPFECYSCHQKGHRSFECPKKNGGGSGANASGTLKSGNFRPPTCHECGEQGHIRPNCPKKGSANVTAFSRSSTHKLPGGTSPPPDAPKIVTMNAFSNMCSETPSEAEMCKGVIGPQCTATILVNGVEVKALFDLGSQVNIISRDCLREVLRKGNVPSEKLSPGVIGHPPGVNMMNASGAPMKFYGLGHCMVQTEVSDTAEEHKFLIQEKTNYDVVLGTPILMASRKWGERLISCTSKEERHGVPHCGFGPCYRKWSQGLADGQHCHCPWSTCSIVCGRADFVVFGKRLPDLFCAAAKSRRKKKEKKMARGVPSRGGGGGGQPTRGRGGNTQFGSRRGQGKRGQP